jgi:hypothetical protein
VHAVAHRLAGQATLALRDLPAAMLGGTRHPKKARMGRPVVTEGHFKIRYGRAGWNVPAAE